MNNVRLLRLILKKNELGIFPISGLLMRMASEEMGALS